MSVAPFYTEEKVQRASIEMTPNEAAKTARKTFLRSLSPAQRAEMDVIDTRQKHISTVPDIQQQDAMKAELKQLREIFMRGLNDQQKQLRRDWMEKKDAARQAAQSQQQGMAQPAMQNVEATADKLKKELERLNQIKEKFNASLNTDQANWLAEMGALSAAINQMVSQPANA